MKNERLIFHLTSLTTMGIEERSFEATNLHVGDESLLICY